MGSYGNLNFIPYQGQNTISNIKTSDQETSTYATEQTNPNIIHWTGIREWKLLLGIQFVCHERGIRLPLGEIAHYVDPVVDETGILEFLSRIRRQLLEQGYSVPPPLGCRARASTGSSVASMQSPWELEGAPFSPDITQLTELGGLSMNYLDGFSKNSPSITTRKRKADCPAPDGIAFGLQTCSQTITRNAPAQLSFVPHNYASMSGKQVNVAKRVKRSSNKDWTPDAGWNGNFGLETDITEPNNFSPMVTGFGSSMQRMHGGVLERRQVSRNEAYDEEVRSFREAVKQNNIRLASMQAAAAAAATTPTTATAGGVRVKYEEYDFSMQPQLPFVPEAGGIANSKHLNLDNTFRTYKLEEPLYYREPQQLQTSLSGGVTKTSTKEHADPFWDEYRVLFGEPPHLSGADAKAKPTTSKVQALNDNFGSTTEPELKVKTEKEDITFPSLEEDFDKTTAFHGPYAGNELTLPTMSLEATYEADTDAEFLEVANRAKEPQALTLTSIDFDEDLEDFEMNNFTSGLVYNTRN